MQSELVSSSVALRYVPIGRTPGAPHEIDWSAAPPRYKHYPGAERFILGWNPGDHNGTGLDRLLCDLYGQTRVTWVYPADSMFRFHSGLPRVAVAQPAPSGGALYPLSIYVATGLNHQVPPGLYHYDAAHHTLELLRPGDHRPALVTLLTRRPAHDPSLILVITTRFWRNAFKYLEFGYRPQSQEAGVVAAQALALADAMDVTASVHLQFADERINRLIGLETFRETAMAVLTLTESPMPASTGSPPLSYDELVVQPIAQAEHRPQDISEVLPLTAALHTSSLPESVMLKPYRLDIPVPPRSLRVPLPNVKTRLAEGIADRASPPNGFAPEPLSLHHLASVLDAASASYPGELLPECDRYMGTVPYCLLLHVDGIAAGAYRYLPAENALVPVGTPEALRRLLTETRMMMLTRLALNEAGMALIPVGNYEAGIRAHSDRWYRMQNIEAGIMIHRGALAATALNLTARIFSDGTRDTVDDALGLGGTPNQSLSMLLVGHRRLSPMLLNLVPGMTRPRHKLIDPPERENKHNSVKPHIAQPISPKLE